MDDPDKDFEKLRKNLSDAREGDMPHEYEDLAGEELLIHMGVFHSGRDNNPAGCIPEVHKALHDNMGKAIEEFR